ncbi:hypothetical protein [Robiginitalea biformata]|nr:hypothetical protein [Robiginitalea biformata]
MYDALLLYLASPTDFDGTDRKEIVFRSLALELSAKIQHRAYGLTVFLMRPDEISRRTRRMTLSAHHAVILLEALSTTQGYMTTLQRAVAARIIEPLDRGLKEPHNINQVKHL